MTTDIQGWTSETVKGVLGAALDFQEAEQSQWKLIYLKELADELKAENANSLPPIDVSLADRILLARLSLDPQADVMSDDGEKLQALASLPDDITSWDYLCLAYRRCRAEESRIKKVLGSKAPHGQAVLDELRRLLTSYMGLVLQDASIFPGTSKNGGKMTVSGLTLLPSLLKESTAASGDPYTSSSSSSSAAYQLPRKGEWATIDSVDLPLFLSELAERFQDEGLEEIIEPPLHEISRHVRNGRDAGGSAQATTQSDSANGQNSAAEAEAARGRALQEAAAAGNVQAVLAQLLAGGAPAAGGGVPGGRAAAGPSRNEGMTIEGMDWRSHLTAVVETLEVKPIAAKVPSLPEFTPASATGPSVENDSLLGPLLRLSSFIDVAPSVAQTYFSDLSQAANVNAGITTLRGTLQLVHQLHFRMFNAMVRASPESREGVLAFWSKICELNKRRGVMRVRKSEVATDGFMVNVFETALRFAEPFMDPKYTKIDRIDLEYHRRQKRFDVSDLTRLSATEQEAAKWAEEGGEFTSAPNFITESFYLTVRLASLGVNKALRTFNDKADERQRLKRRAAEIEQDRASWSTTPQAPQFEAFLKKVKADCDNINAGLVAAEVQLLEPDFSYRLLTLISFVMTWLVRVADPTHQHPQKQVSLPLPKEVPDVFRMLPEHIFEDVCETLIFLGRYKPDSLPEAVKNDLITFCTTFLSSGWYIKNPFLKAKLAEILFFFVLPYGSNQTGFLGELLNFHKLAIHHLVPAIMSFWVEAESTGSHTQFYDKFTIRSHLARVFKVIWRNPQHKERIHAQADTNKDGFIIFVNRLLNDVTFLLDDALERLSALHKQQVEMADEATYSQKSAEDRQEFEGHMRQNESHARSMLGYGNEFLETLIDFSGESGRVRDAFMQPEIVSRLAPMLDYTLDMLVGPKAQDLKLKDPKKAGFDIKHLIRQLLSVFLSLSSRPEFVQAIARDERSYRREIFEKAARLSQRYMLKSPPEIEVLLGLVGQVEKIKQMEAEEEEDLGEIPDDFCDPLMATLMTEPVILPSSKAVIDLSTIKSHLLSDATDPFNRVPLKIEDVLPATDLKAQIDAWVAERKRAKGKTATS
ncbi:hypothetical protein IE81DRAFT_320175 [Ceraceosorus guamensis]|uniref:RING-type E3 ubiquitin transferase n=1 Tax=Ceraceosorus guamensis TaxID=1522189 RepID=A0A316W6A7_9BASI|nr:hypothetical protein IE81DRAFT_320175 [Ceraceosorus guamensis]PWN45419.1 hypothetical protein IE81DRAFT_320175 [Ceraceosorus guamensis]